MDYHALMNIYETFVASMKSIPQENSEHEKNTVCWTKIAHKFKGVLNFAANDINDISCHHDNTFLIKYKNQIKSISNENYRAFLKV